jgi:PadR family transcriptional regulator
MNLEILGCNLEFREYYERMVGPLDIQAILLQVLLEGEAFGLEVIARIEERTGGKLRFAQGTVYPALRQMERDGLLTSREGDPLPERGGRPRIFYSLTRKGQKAARAARELVEQLFQLPPAKAQG